MQDGKVNLLKFKDNPFQYTRSISFRADLDSGDQKKILQKIKPHKLKAKENFSLSNFSCFLLDCHRDFEKLIYKKEKKTEKKRKLSINKIWLKKWHKDIYFNSNRQKQNQSGKYFFEDLKKVQAVFKERLNNWKKSSEFLKKYSEQDKHSQFRKANISDQIKALLSNQGIFYFRDFLNELHASDSYLDKDITDLKQRLDNILKNLESIKYSYLSLQSSGVEVAKASLNYYTVNKKPKNYEDKLMNKKNQLGWDYFKNENLKEKLSDTESFSKINKKNSGYWVKNNKNDKVFTFQSSQEKEWIERYYKKYREDLIGDLDKGLSLSCNQTYSMMKLFRAEQKNLFYELTTHIASEKNKGESCQIKNKKYILSGYSFSYNKISDFKKFNKLFSLFIFADRKDKSGKKKSGEEHYRIFIELSKKIQGEQDLKKRAKYEKEKGKYLQIKPGYSYFKGYKKFCDSYRKVAQERGKLISQIKGIEREKREASQTSHWALIYTDKKKKQLWLVPKNLDSNKFLVTQSNQRGNKDTNLKLAKDFIYSEKRANYKKNSAYLSCFESLTMRALHKLCFAEESSFVEEMPSDLKKQQKYAKQMKTNGEDSKLKEKKQKEIEFLKDVLKSDYANGKLQLKNFKLESVDQAEDQNTFEKELEKVCYYEKKIYLNEKEKQDFLQKFSVIVLNINSYDLENNNRKHKQEDNNKYHTELWKAFWNSENGIESSKVIRGFNVGKIRLNPEIRIRWREANKELKDYFKKRNFPDKFKHRQKQDQFTACFTLSLNAGKIYEDLAFVKSKDLINKINNFNHKLNASMSFKTAWRYGIDRGNIELATLCLAKFDSDKDIYMMNREKKLQPTFPNLDKTDINCYSLKNYNLSNKKESQKTRYAVKNLSYFIEDKYLDDENCFSKNSVTCLDLTTAKVIKGKVITNGDIMTYLKLKKGVAKRRLFELYGENKIKEPVEIKWSKFEHGDTEKKREDGVLNIKIPEGEKTIYWYCKKYENVILNIQKDIRYNHDSIKNSLIFYLNQLKQDDDNHTPSITSINHLRDALIANMVGVVCFLQKKYPGFIIMEDLEKNIIDGHRFQHEENISRRLENALYNKFQALGLIPPHVKDIISLREQSIKNKQKKIEQIGAIIFVPKEDTSKKCPYCEKVTQEQQKDIKFRQYRFLCSNTECKFDTYLFKEEKERVEGYKPEIQKNNKAREFLHFKDINDPDKVAAYNITKKIKTDKDISDMKLGE